MAPGKEYIITIHDKITRFCYPCDENQFVYAIIDDDNIVKVCCTRCQYIIEISDRYALLEEKFGLSMKQTTDIRPFDA